MNRITIVLALTFCIAGATRAQQSAGSATHAQRAPAISAQKAAASPVMFLNRQEYLQNQGVNVMLAQDFYPEGHQGGVGIIQNGQRVATNGDIRLEPTPGQWSPIPKVGQRSRSEE